MGVEFLVCKNCEETFCDCGDFVFCENCDMAITANNYIDRMCIAFSVN